MRVTQGMMSSRMLANLYANNERLAKYQDQMATQRRLNKPSDDPVGVGYAMRYEAQIAQNDQYQQNVDSAKSQLEYLDTIMNQLNAVMQRARELAVQGASGTNSAESRQSIAKEVKQMYEQAVTIGNSQFGGSYLFNGYRTDVKPFQAGTPAEMISTDSGIINYSVGEGITVPINLSAYQVFGLPTATAADPNSDNVFASLAALEKGLNNNDTDAISQALAKVSDRMDKVQYAWAEIGARSNRLEMVENRLQDYDLNLQSLLSKTVDADVPEVVTQLKMAESVQRASLEIGARIIQPSLVDFLK